MRRFLSPIAVRLLLFNVLLVFLPVAGFFSLETFERQLLDLQERSMVQQGRLVAAALSENANGVTAESSRALIQRLGGRSESRIRVLDGAAKVIADSATRGGAVASAMEDASPANDPESRKRLLYRVGARVYRVLAAIRGFFARESDPGAGSSVRNSSGTPSPRNSEELRGPRGTSSSGEATPRDIVRNALAGRYSATLRESAGQRSLTLYSALPVRAGGDGPVIGVVMVSQSTSRILRALWRVRLDLVEVFALSVFAAIVLSLILSATIARPLIRLRDEADELLDHRGRLRRTFRGSRRRDEIGDLTRALERLTGRLERHLVFVESFSADVSHEFKNPLASIRNAAELLTLTDEPSQRDQLAGTIDREVARLSRLLNGVRELSKVDAAVDLEVAKPVDVRAVISELASPRPMVDVTLPPQPLFVTVSEDRLVQAVRNVVDNAESFSPPHERIRLSLRERDGFAVIRVDDAGPGIPPEHLDRVFDRFFSFRPHEAGRRRDHDGLGLAIARAIVEAYGGSLSASNLTPHGARVELCLPRSPLPGVLSSS